MSRSPNSIDSPEPAPSSATPPPLRLQLDPNRPVEPDLDGAFWPHSHELSTELPPLLEALSTHLGQIAIVGYHRDAWGAAPGKLDVAGHTVHLQDFVSPNPPTVIVIADTGRRVTLRVVPPETDVCDCRTGHVCRRACLRRGRHRWVSDESRRQRGAFAGRTH